MDTQAKTRVLIVDDDNEICTLLKEFLSKHQFDVSTANTAEHANKLIDETKFDLMVLDIMLPDDDGISLCAAIRTKQPNVPIVMLTAINENTEQILSLEKGADVYLTKPFNMRVLLAHLNALLRRAENQETKKEVSTYAEKYCFITWELDTTKRQLFDSSHNEVILTSGEYDLLLALVENPRRVLTRDRLMDLTRSREVSPLDRTIDVQISRLRYKLEVNPKEPKIIKTVRNGGYMFTEKVLMTEESES